MSRIPPSARAIAGALLALAFALQSAAALDRCDPPFAFPGDDVASTANGNFAAGSEATVMWDPVVGNGYNLEVSLSPATKTSGAFKTPIPDYSISVGKNATQRTFTGLSESTYYYHVQAKAKAGVCDDGWWSNTVAIIQDATPPEATFTTAPAPIAAGIAPPALIFTSGAKIRIQGTSADAPATTVPAGSGPLFVVLTVQNTTPVLGASVEPTQAVLLVDTDGSWLQDLTGVSPGTYRASAIAIDRVGNQQPDATSLSFIVL